MDDVQRYAWLGGTRFGWLRRGACVTFVHGLGEDEVIRRFGGDPSVTSQASLPEPCDVDLYPDRLLDRMRYLPFGLAAKYRGAGMALASRVSGVWITPTWVNAPHQAVLLDGGP
jgi:hypothetical protein